MWKEHLKKKTKNPKYPNIKNCCGKIYRQVTFILNFPIFSTIIISKTKFFKVDTSITIISDRTADKKVTHELSPKR